MDDVGDIRRSFFETLNADDLAVEEELSQIEDLPRPLSRSLTPSVLSQISAAGSTSTVGMHTAYDNIRKCITVV